MQSSTGKEYPQFRATLNQINFQNLNTLNRKMSLYIQCSVDTVTWEGVCLDRPVGGEWEMCPAPVPSTNWTLPILSRNTDHALAFLCQDWKFAYEVYIKKTVKKQRSILNVVRRTGNFVSFEINQLLWYFNTCAHSQKHANGRVRHHICF